MADDRADRYIRMMDMPDDRDHHIVLIITDKGKDTYKKMKELYKGSAHLHHPSMMRAYIDISFLELLTDYGEPVSLGELQFEMYEFGDVPYAVSAQGAKRLIKSGDLRAINLN